MSTQIQHHAVKPNKFWTTASAIALSLLAAATPFLVVLLLKIAHPADIYSEQPTSSSTISVGIPTGLIIGFLIGLRRGRLRDLFLGPAIGLAIGYADFKGFVFLMRQGSPVSIANAALIPIWGAGMGIWAGMSRRRYWQVLGTIFIVAAADYVGRIDWPWLNFAHEQWPFTLRAAFTYLPPSLMAVALTARSQPSTCEAMTAPPARKIGREHSRSLLG